MVSLWKWLKERWWMAIPVILLAGAAGIGIYVAVTGSTKAVFDFNDGTVQGWTFDGVFDDKGNKYNGVTFPQKILANPKPGNYQQGGTELVFAPNQLGLYLSKYQLYDANGKPTLKWPQDSKYWQVDLISPNLGPAWKGLSGIEAKIKDEIAIRNDALEVAVIVKYFDAGAEKETTSTFHKLPNKTWKGVSQSMTIPSGATLQKIILRIRGTWKNDDGTIDLYNGQIYVDDVAKML